LAVILGGQAQASGSTTDATGVVTNNIVDHGRTSIAYGSATFEAIGQSASPGQATAAASTFLDVTGADLVIEINRLVDGHSGGTTWEVAQTTYVAVDIAGWSPPNGTIVKEIDIHGSGGFGSGGHLSSITDHAGGNLASVIAAANALGSNTLTATETHALTVENHFSAVAGFAMVVA
jgi:hypothetical protein